MKHPLSRTFAAALAFVACLATDSLAQDRPGCAAPSNVHEFCDKRRTVSSIVTFPQAQRWIGNHGLKNASGRARITISCDHDGDEGNTGEKTTEDKNTPSQSDGMTMFLWNPATGTIGLAYSKMFDQAGLVFSMVPFERSNRRSASGTTPGTFVLLNRCELLRGYVTGLIFNAGQIVPLNFHGSIDRDSSDWDQSGTESALPSTGGPSAKEAAMSMTASSANSGAVTPWDFSGIYEFEMEDEDCLTRRGLMKSYKQRSPEEMLGYILPESRRLTRQQQMVQPSRYWEKVCPPRKARLVVDAVAGDTPIYNLDHGTFVTHYVIGKWDGHHFHSVTPNGDTTGPNRGMFKIDGEINPNGSLDFFLFEPNLGKTGRLWPVSGSPKIWMTVEPFHALKKLDVYCYLGIRPKKDCVSWDGQDWDGYLYEVWKQTQKSLGIN